MRCLVGHVTHKAQRSTDMMGGARVVNDLVSNFYFQSLLIYTPNKNLYKSRKKLISVACLGV